MGTRLPAATTEVALYAAAEPRRPYTVLGFVSATARNEGLLVSELQAQAASLGASAVIGLRVSMTSGSWLRASAVAVKWS